KRSNGRVFGTAVVKDKRVSSNGGVVDTGGIEQQRCSANCCIVIPVVEDQRSATNTSAKAGVGIGKKRTPTECRISSACDVVHERIITEKCVEETVVATLLTNRLRSW